MIIQSLKTAAAAKLDQRVADGKLVWYWRDFWHLTSNHWSIIGFITTCAGSWAIAAEVEEPLRWMFPELIVNLILAAIFLAIMWERMKPKAPPPSDPPPEPPSP